MTWACENTTKKKKNAQISYSTNGSLPIWERENLLFKVYYKLITQNNYSSYVYRKWHIIFCGEMTHRLTTRRKKKWPIVDWLLTKNINSTILMLDSILAKKTHQSWHDHFRSHMLGWSLIFIISPPSWLDPILWSRLCI